MDQAVRKYMSELGRKGGRRSKRTLSPEVAREMVRLREARRAFRAFHALCFWSFDPDYVVQSEDIPWIVERLQTFGGRAGWEKGASLCP